MKVTKIDSAQKHETSVNVMNKQFPGNAAMTKISVFIYEIKLEISFEKMCSPLSN